MHTIEITYTQKNPHTGTEIRSVRLDGDGSLEHFSRAYASMLKAAGYDVSEVLSWLRPETTDE